MYCTHFTYNGDSTEDHGVMICSFNGGDEEPVSGGKVEITSVKAPNSNKWIKTNATYKEPLTFSFEICKDPCSIIGSQNKFSFSPSDQVEMKRWLERKESHYLTFDDGDMENIYFNSQIKLTEQKKGGQVIGYKLDVTCDAPWGWSEERIANLYSQKDESGNEIGIVELFDASDEIGNVVPTVELTAINDGTIELYNDNTTDTTIILNCKAGEVITMTEPFRIHSNIEHKNLRDDFNWVYPRIQNSYTSNRNTFELINCKVKISWREPRKAVI